MLVQHLLARALHRIKILNCCYINEYVLFILQYNKFFIIFITLFVLWTMILVHFIFKSIEYRY